LTERPSPRTADPAAQPAAGWLVRLLRAPRLASALILALAAAGLFAWVVLVGHAGARGAAVVGPGITTLLVLAAALTWAQTQVAHLSRLQDELDRFGAAEAPTPLQEAMLFCGLTAAINMVVLAGLLGEDFMRSTAYPALGFGIVGAAAAGCVVHRAMARWLRPRAGTGEAAWRLALLSGGLALGLVAGLESMGVLAHTNPWLEAVVLGLAAASGHALYLLFSLLWPGGRRRAALR
jgi:hypothetical protein